MTAAEKIAQQVERQVAQRERAKALVDGRRELVTKLIERRFGPIDAATRKQLESRSEEQLDEWALRVLDATCDRRLERGHLNLAKPFLFL